MKRRRETKASALFSTRFAETSACERHFSLALEPVCRNIATINRTRKAGGFSGRLSPGNQLTPAHISIDIAAASIPIGNPQ